jgi:hypothetical protein
MDYSLFMEVMMVLTLEKVEKRLGATPTAFSSPIFAGTASISCFSDAPDRDGWGGGVYI